MEYADGVTVPDPVVITGAFQNRTFTRPAPGVLSYGQPAGAAESVINNTQPVDGCATVTVAANGTLTLEPLPGFTGNCSFTFTVRDTAGGATRANAVVIIGEST